MNTAMVT